MRNSRLNSGVDRFPDGIVVRAKIERKRLHPNALDLICENRREDTSVLINACLVRFLHVSKGGLHAR